MNHVFYVDAETFLSVDFFYAHFKALTQNEKKEGLAHFFRSFAERKKRVCVNAQPIPGFESSNMKNILGTEFVGLSLFLSLYDA
jgi:hypothetical protein